MPKAPRVEVSDKEIEKVFTDDLIKQLTKKLKKHGNGAYHGPHESLGITTEEFWELVEAVKSNNIDDVESELFDVAIACLWGVASLRTTHK